MSLTRFTALALALAPLAACATSHPVPMPTHTPAPCPPEMDPDACRVERLGATNLGWLDVGVSLDTVKAKLGEPSAATEPEVEGASGETYRTFSWEAAGVWVDARPGPDGATWYIHGFSVKAPFAERSARGVGIGSTEAEVVAAYRDVTSPDSTVAGVTLVAGSVYGGMFFSFNEGKVFSIFVGAGAE